LEQEIREDRKRKKEIMRRLNLSIAQTHTELSESGQVAQHLHSKWLQKTREKRKEFNQYVGFLESLRQGLGQMKDVSGLDDYEQVAKIFQNSMERQREIQNHLIKLTEQIETIKGELKHAQSYINANNSSVEKIREERELRMNSAKAQLRSVESSMEKGKETLKEVKEAVVTLVDPVRLLKEMCREVGVAPEITPGGLTSDEEFTLETAGLHLLSLEEALFKLAALLHISSSVHSDDSNFFFLTEKRFDKTINITALLKDESLLTGEEENHPLNPSEFRQRAERALGHSLPI
jgi:chromosome segregation ATPase